jgi:hypothetical protein
MFPSRPSEHGLGMASSQQPNLTVDQHAHPEDPETNTRPPGNGDRDEPDIQRGEEKLQEVLGQ